MKFIVDVTVDRDIDADADDMAEDLHNLLFACGDDVPPWVQSWDGVEPVRP